MKAIFAAAPAPVREVASALVIATGAAGIVYGLVVLCWLIF